MSAHITRRVSLPILPVADHKRSDATSKMDVKNSELSDCNHFFLKKNFLIGFLQCNRNMLPMDFLYPDPAVWQSDSPFFFLQSHCFPVSQSRRNLHFPYTYIFTRNGALAVASYRIRLLTTTNGAMENFVVLRRL
jgi:hypothetical protein